LFNLKKRQLKNKYSNLKQICRISCATGEGIEELKNAIQNTLPDIELLNTQFPAKWFKVKTAIAEQAKKRNFTSYEQYVEICEDNGITQESEQNTLINFLHDLGIINHFQEDRATETIALVETDTESKRIELKITGPQKREYLFILRFVLADIHNSFSHLKVTEKIGLPDSQSSVSYNHLLKLDKKGRKEYDPEDSEKSYNVKELLGMVTAPNSETKIMERLDKIISILRMQGIEEEKDLSAHIGEVVKFEPSLFGLKVDGNAAIKKINNWFKD
jgi:hypothetical protein